MKHAIAALLSDNLPAMAILEEYTTSPALADADHILAGDPPDLLAAVDDLLLPYGKRHTAHVRRKAHAVVKRAEELVETAKYIVIQNRQTRAESRKSRSKNKDGKKSG
jgi:hypothetical protein